MTFNQFLVKFQRKVRRAHVHFNTLNYGLRYDHRCPIEFVAGMPWGTVDKAAEKLGLSHDAAARILRAADVDDETCDRQALKQCGRVR